MSLSVSLEAMFVGDYSPMENCLGSFVEQLSGAMKLLDFACQTWALYFY